ncbi:hypothetical protein B566_EDAN003962 [Ephemera danica]|nr:hypothetical protein B566_EDAN003962 [Ephemera danica]
MADADRVSNGKWSKTIQENDGARDNGYYRGGRRGGRGNGGGGGGGGGNKPNQKIYRPGSGPLRKTGPRDDEECDNSNNNFADNSHSPTRDEGNRSFSGRGASWRKPSQQLYQPPIGSRESTPGPSDTKLVTEKMSQLSTSPSDNHCMDDRKKSKKPEQPIYVPKARAQALASEHSGDSDGASSSQARSSSSRGKYEESGATPRNKTEQSSKGNKGNTPEPYQKSSKPESPQQQVQDKRGLGKTDNYNAKWDAPNRMTKSDTWEQPIKGSKNDVWERGRGRDEYGDWRRPSRDMGGSNRGGRSGDQNRSKRFSGSRRGNQHQDDGVRWRAESPSSSSSGRMYRSESITGLSPSREIRQTSEPRSLPLDPSRHLRDTRSVEPQQPPLLPALPPKPPSGRRNRDSKAGIKINLPPRFQKKAEMAANALDDWDGSKSLMFQGHSHTLPHSGSRGRGRHRQDEMRGDMYSGPPDHRNTRSLTPDQFKRPGTPPSLYHHRAPSPKGRRGPSPHRHRTDTPTDYSRRTPSQENVWPRGGRRSPPPHHRGHSPSQGRTHSQERRQYGGRRSPQQHQGRGGMVHQEQQGKYKPRSGSNSWENNDPFYRNRRMSDTSKPPVPSHGQRRPSLGSDDQKPSNATENPPQGPKQEVEEVPLPRLPVLDIKDWSEEVEASERQEAEAEAAASSSESGPPPGSQRQRTISESSRKSKSKRSKRRSRGGDRGGDDRETPHRSPTREQTGDSPNNRSTQHHTQVQGSSGPHQRGIIILPNPSTESSTSPGPNFVPPHMMSHPPPSPHQQRVLFDPSNPNKPIFVMAGGMRVAHPGHPQFAQFNQSPGDMQGQHPVFNSQQQMPQPFPPGHFMHGGYPQKLPTGPEMNVLHGPAEAMMSGRPNWYDHYSERQFLLKSLHTLLMTELKFCQMENVEQHIWKIVFYNVIEMLRKGMADDPNTESRARYKQTLMAVLEEGVNYFEGLLEALQQNFKFSMEHLTGPNAPPFTPHAHKDAPFTNLAIISAQKICIFLGDIARYKEQASESSISTYTKARQWYTKAQVLNPKNGRPYNQLAILALYARRKLDAVYFYMRSLMASNPFQTARESLLALFDENRKKFESLEKRRKEERAAVERERQREKEALGRGLRREIWVHPDDGHREWRTTSNREKSPDARDEELARMPLPEVNRQFVTSYLHVQGKLFTKVGMETFQEAAVQMLREFRALLQHSPVPVSCTRFLQLLALNMFAIENTQLRGEYKFSVSFHHSQLSCRKNILNK